jgi:hypothetical protein
MDQVETGIDVEDTEPAIGLCAIEPHATRLAVRAYEVEREVGGLVLRHTFAVDLQRISLQPVLEFVVINSLG